MISARVVVVPLCFSHRQTPAQAHGYNQVWSLRVIASDETKTNGRRATTIPLRILEAFRLAITILAYNINVGIGCWSGSLPVTVWSLRGILSDETKMNKGRTTTFPIKFLRQFIRLGNRATLGPLRKFIEYCRIVELLPVIPYTQRNNS